MSTRRTPACLSLLILAMVGCASGPPPEPVCPHLQRLSKDSWRIYDEAMHEWATAHSLGLHGQDLGVAMQAVYSRLETALEASKYSELILIKMAEVLMEAGTVNDAQAEAHLFEVLDSSHDWPPAWYLLAWMQLRKPVVGEAELEAAQEFINQFEIAMARVSNWHPAPDDPGYVPEEPQAPGFYDQHLNDFDRHIEFGKQMAAYLSWSKTNQLLTKGVKGINVEEISSAGVDDALTARAKFLKLMINDRRFDLMPDAADKGTRLAEMAVILQDEIEPLDYDFYQARKRRAELLYLLGDYPRAAKVTSTLIDSSNPMLANDPELVYLAVEIHSDWLAARLAELPADRSVRDDDELVNLFAYENDYSTRLLGADADPAMGVPALPGIDPGHVGGRLKKVEFMLALAAHSRRAGDGDLLADALQTADAYLAGLASMVRDPADQRRLGELQARRRQV